MGNGSSTAFLLIWPLPQAASSVLPIATHFPLPPHISRKLGRGKARSFHVALISVYEWRRRSPPTAASDFPQIPGYGKPSIAALESESFVLQREERNFRVSQRFRFQFRLDARLRTCPRDEVVAKGKTMIVASASVSPHAESLQFHDHSSFGRGTCHSKLWRVSRSLSSERHGVQPCSEVDCGPGDEPESLTEELKRTRRDGS